MAEVETENHTGRMTCESLLQLLRKIWDEVGETDEERDQMLLQLEQECLDVYKRKVYQAIKSRAQLLDTLEEARVELTKLQSALGEKSYVGITFGTIKEQLEAMTLALEKLRKQKGDRIRDFSEVQSQINIICAEIAGADEPVQTPSIDESDLSTNKLNEFQAQLLDLQKEKSDRLRKVLDFVNTIHDLCAVLGIDFSTTVTDVHPSLNDSHGAQSKSISNDTLSRLAKTVLALKEDKKKKLHKVEKRTSSSEEESRIEDYSKDTSDSSKDELYLYAPKGLQHDLGKLVDVQSLAMNMTDHIRRKVVRVFRRGGDGSSYKDVNALQVMFDKAMDIVEMVKRYKLAAENAKGRESPKKKKKKDRKRKAIELDTEESEESVAETEIDVRKEVTKRMRSDNDAFYGDLVSGRDGTVRKVSAVRSVEKAKESIPEEILEVDEDEENEEGEEGEDDGREYSSEEDSRQITPVDTSDTEPEDSRQITQVDEDEENEEGGEGEDEGREYSSEEDSRQITPVDTSDTEPEDSRQITQVDEDEENEEGEEGEDDDEDDGREYSSEEDSRQITPVDTSDTEPEDSRQITPVDTSDTEPEE